MFYLVFLLIKLWKGWLDRIKGAFLTKNEDVCSLKGKNEVGFYIKSIFTNYIY